MAAVPENDPDLLPPLAAPDDDVAPSRARPSEPDGKPVDEAVRQRLHDIIDSATHADQLAQALIERVDALHERAAVVQHTSLEGLLDQFKALHGQLSDGLDHEQQLTHDAEQQAQATNEQARNGTASAVDALVAQTGRLGKAVSDEVQSTAATLSNLVQVQVGQFAQLTLASLADLQSKTQASWSRAQDDVRRAFDDVLHKTGESLSGSQAGSLKAGEEFVHRIEQLKSEVDDCARALGQLIGTFSELMGATRTGLNVTAGTLTDLVSIFKEIT